MYWRDGHACKYQELDHSCGDTGTAQYVTNPLLWTPRPGMPITGVPSNLTSLGQHDITLEVQDQLHLSLACFRTDYFPENGPLAN